jgi:hypothetical protein
VDIKFHLRNWLKTHAHVVLRNEPRWFPVIRTYSGTAPSLSASPVTTAPVPLHAADGVPPPVRDYAGFIRVASSMELQRALQRNWQPVMSTRYWCRTIGLLKAQPKIVVPASCFLTPSARCRESPFAYDSAYGPGHLAFRSGTPQSQCSQRLPQRVAWAKEMCASHSRSGNKKKLKTRKKSQCPLLQTPDTEKTHGAITRQLVRTAVQPLTPVVIAQYHQCPGLLQCSRSVNHLDWGRSAQQPGLKISVHIWKHRIPCIVSGASPPCNKLFTYLTTQFQNRSIFTCSVSRSLHPSCKAEHIFIMTINLTTIAWSLHSPASSWEGFRLILPLRLRTIHLWPPELTGCGYTGTVVPAPGGTLSAATATSGKTPAGLTIAHATILHADVARQFDTRSLRSHSAKTSTNAPPIPSADMTLEIGMIAGDFCCMRLNMSLLRRSFGKCAP